MIRQKTSKKKKTCKELLKTYSLTKNQEILKYVLSDEKRCQFGALRLVTLQLLWRYYLGRTKMAEKWKTSDLISETVTNEQLQSAGESVENIYALVYLASNLLLDELKSNLQRAVLYKAFGKRHVERVAKKYYETCAIIYPRWKRLRSALWEDSICSIIHLCRDGWWVICSYKYSTQREQ